MFGVIGGVNPFIKFKEDGSNGLVGATTEARRAIANNKKTIEAANTANGDRLKSKTKSL